MQNKLKKDTEQSISEFNDIIIKAAILATPTKHNKPPVLRKTTSDAIEKLEAKIRPARRKWQANRSLLIRLQLKDPVCKLKKPTSKTICPW